MAAEIAATAGDTPPIIPPPSLHTTVQIGTHIPLSIPTFAAMPENTPNGQNSFVSNTSRSSLSGRHAGVFNASLTQINTVKLDRTNFLLWKSTVVPIVRGHRLDGILFGTKPPPARFLNPVPGSGLVCGESNPEYEDWVAADQLLMGWLMSSMSEHALVEVVGCESSSAVWLTLEALYNSRSEARMLEYKGALSKTEKGAKSMSDYLALMKSFSDGLMSAGYPISTSELILAALGGLGKEYESVIVNVTSRIGSLSWQEVQSQLLIHERLIARFNPPAVLDLKLSDVNVAMSRSGNFRPSSRPSSNPPYSPESYRGRGFRGRGFRGRGGRNNFYSSRPTCQVCSKVGHTASSCYHRFDASYGNSTFSPRPTSQLSNASPFSAAPRPTAAYFATPDSVGDPNWYMDSGATSHVTSDLNSLHLSSGYEGSDSLTVGNECSPAKDGPSKSTRLLKILCYNIWFREDLEMQARMDALGDLIWQHNPDIMCFQEVTPDSYEMFRKSSWWKMYQCSLSNEMTIVNPYFCIQLCKLPVKRYSCQPFTYSAMGRELCVAEIDVQSDKTLVVATSHLESPCPGPPTWDQMFSKERVGQAKEAIKLLEKHKNVIFCGDMNWDDKLDGEFPMPDGWFDVWKKLRPQEDGWTYDTKLNKMLSANRSLRKRLDRFICNLRDFELSEIEMIGTEEIAGLSYCKEKKAKNQIKQIRLPVLPSDHFGLLLTIRMK